MEKMLLYQEMIEEFRDTYLDQYVIIKESIGVNVMFFVVYCGNDNCVSYCLSREEFSNFCVIHEIIYNED